MESRIQAYLRVAAPSGRDVERIGPFLATFHPHNANPYVNYAIPDDNAQPSPSDVAALIVAYERRGRLPRLEYMPGVAPAVGAALLDGGFVVERQTPLMTCGLGSVQPLPVPPGIELIGPRSDTDFLATASAQHEAYGETEPPGQAEVDALRSTLDAGGLIVLARDAKTGEAAGGGVATPPHAGATEIAGIGVRPAYRRRGIAAAMTAWLTQSAFAAGMTSPFLMAAAEAEERIYARAGYVTRSQVLHISRPAKGEGTA
jgi:ribosomal protein S18 acetylase RimI-like enzyme